MAKKKVAKKTHKKDLSTIKRKNFIKNNKLFFIFLGFLIVVATLSILLSSPDVEDNKVYGDDVVEMYYFHSVTCPYCIEQNKFNKELQEIYPQLKIIKFEASTSMFRERYVEFAERFDELDPNRASTPITIIGDRVQVGYASPESTGLVIVEMIEDEIDRIEQGWDDSTMVRTTDLR